MYLSRFNPEPARSEALRSDWPYFPTNQSTICLLCPIRSMCDDGLHAGRDQAGYIAGWPHGCMARGCD